MHELLKRIENAQEIAGVSHVTALQFSNVLFHCPGDRQRAISRTEREIAQHKAKRGALRADEDIASDLVSNALVSQCIDS